MDEAVVKKIVRSVLTEVQGTYSEPKMTLDLAVALINKVEEKAREMGMAVVVAVCNEGARPVAVHCMDGAFIGSYDVAVNKTFTSVGFKMSTAKLGELSAPGGELYGIQHTNEGKIVIFGGGEPLYLNGKLVGALGVSGGTAEQDTKLAEYGKDVFKEVASWQ